MSTGKQGEFALIEWIKSTQSSSPAVLTGIGDDCAVLQSTGKQLLVTTDMLMEGSCFLIAEAGPFRVGRKAMAVNLSDIAAMGGKPTVAFVSLGIPKSMPFKDVQELHRGMQSMAELFGVVIAGGDTNSWDGPLTISVTLLGEPSSKGAILRSGARVGDAIFVTGPLGGSILSHHLDFMPQVTMGQWLTEHGSIHSMIDISDGLAKDLSRILEASSVGAELVAVQIPISADARTLSACDGKTPLTHALTDGEDFELLFTADAETSLRLENAAKEAQIELFRIGRVIEKGLVLITEQGQEMLKVSGYEHHFGEHE